MRRIVVLISLWSATWAFPEQISRWPNNLGARILGGKDANIEQFPYQVSIRTEGRHNCGGTIYRSNVVISAAHCFYGFNWPDLTVTAGTASRTDPGFSSKIKKFILHPDYNLRTINSDIAVVLLETELPFGPTIQPISLAESGEKFAAGSVAYVSGWGDTVETGGLPDVLQYLPVNIIDHDTCVQAHRGTGYSVLDTMLCAGREEGAKGVCQGDSGGPLVLDNKLIGVVSWSLACGHPEYPGVYADVGVLRKWVDEAVDELLKIN